MSTSRGGAFGNIAWLSAERVTRLLLQFVTAVVVIRFLGPADFGVVATVSAITAILVGIQNLGFDALVMDATDDPQSSRTQQVLVTTLGTRMVLGVLFVLGLAIATQIVESADIAVGLLVSMAVVVAMPLDTFRLALDVRRQSRVYVRRRIVVVILHVLIQLSLVAMQADVVFFLGANAATAAAQYTVAAFPWQQPNWRGGFSLAVLRRALPLFVATAAANLHMRVDTVMLSGISGSSEAGIYGAAVQIAELPLFLPVAIAATYFLEMREVRDDPKKEQEILTYTTSLVTGAVGLAAVGLMIVGPLLLPLILGPQFEESALILILYAPSMLFLGWGVIRHRWLVVRNLESHSAISAGIGVAVNIAANLLLIPMWGAIGATLATLLSYAIGMYGYSLAVPACRPAAVAVHQSFKRAPRDLRTLMANRRDPN